MDAYNSSHRPKVFTLGRLRPRIDPAAFIAPGAVLVGDVAIGAGSSVWFNCVLRGDFSTIAVGRNSNIQDNTVIHVDEGGLSTTIGDEVTIGHSSILHGCTLMDRAFAGMGSIILNGATIESDGMLAAGALLTAGKRIPSGQLWAGSPAKFVRELRDTELQEIRNNARLYAENASLYARELSGA